MKVSNNLGEPFNVAEVDDDTKVAIINDIAEGEIPFGIIDHRYATERTYFKKACRVVGVSTHIQRVVAPQYGVDKVLAQAPHVTLGCFYIARKRAAHF